MPDYSYSVTAELGITSSYICKENLAEPFPGVPFIRHTDNTVF